MTPVSEIGEYKYKPGQISETLLNDYMACVQPGAQSRRVNPQPVCEEAS